MTTKYQPELLVIARPYPGQPRRQSEPEQQRACARLPAPAEYYRREALRYRYSDETISRQWWSLYYRARREQGL